MLFRGVRRRGLPGLIGPDARPFCRDTRLGSTGVRFLNEPARTPPTSPAAPPPLGYATPDMTRIRAQWNHVAVIPIASGRETRTRQFPS